MTTAALRRKFENMKGRLAQVQENRKHAEKAAVFWREESAVSQRAREVIQIVAKATQERLRFHISELASVAMAAVFPDPYQIEIEFVQRRNTVEADLFFVRGGNRYDPMDSTGYGTVDVASFALRMAEWSILQPRPRKLLVLDEPFKHIKGEEANARAIQMVAQLSRKLGVQVLMVSDERASRAAVMEGADRVFEVAMRKGRSFVSVVK
jgi:hypothetical protein